MEALPFYRKLSPEEREILLVVLAKRKGFESARQDVLDRVDHLNRSITEVKSEYAAICNNRSVVLSLPARIVARIFEYTSEEAFDAFPEDFLLTEVVISHVCCSWRTIALATPRLWSRFRYSTTECTRIPLDRFDAYLERSPGQLLDLWFDFKGTGIREDHVNFLKRAVPHADRWRRVTILADDDTAVFQVLSPLENSSAPNLEYFRLWPCHFPSQISFEQPEGDESENYDNTLRMIEPKIFKGGMPKLYSLSIDTSTLWATLPPLADTLTSLQIRRDGYDSWKAVLTLKSFLPLLNLPSLTTLSIIGDVFTLSDEEQPEVVPPFTLNQLQHLRFADCDPMWVVLRSLTAPKLESLAIRQTTVPHFPDGFVASPFPSLRILVLAHCRKDELSSLVQFGRMTEAATSLVFTASDYSDIVLSAIHSDWSAEELWPRMKILSLDFDSSPAIRPIMSYISTRRPLSLKLQIEKNWIHTWKTNNLEDYNRLLRRCAVGKLDKNSIDDDKWPKIQVDPITSGAADANDIHEKLSPEERLKVSELLARKQQSEAEREGLLEKMRSIDQGLREVELQYAVIANKYCPSINLPPEVTCMIFDYAQRSNMEDVPPEDDSESESEEDSESDTSSDDGKPSTNYRFMEVVVSQVCRSWRSVALEYPHLWSAFYYVNKLATSVPLARLQAYLERSDNLPLDLYIDCKDSDVWEEHSVLVEKVVPHVKRWRNVSILSDAERIFQILAPLKEASAPLLEYLDISTNAYSGFELPQTWPLANPLLTEGAPKLTSLRLHTEAVFHLCPPLIIITTLELHRDHFIGELPTAMLYALLAIPTLENVAICGNLVEYDDTVNVPIIQMDNLTHLRLRNTELLIYVLYNLQAPKLKTLALHEVSLPEVQHPTTSNYYFPLLKKLSVVQCYIPTGAPRARLCKLTTGVSDVIIETYSSSTDILTSLEGEASPASIWPHLDNLLINTSESDVELAPLIAFGESRPQHKWSVKLRKDQLEVWKTTHSEDYERLQQVCDVVEIDPKNPFGDQAWPPGTPPRPLFMRDNPFNLALFTST